MSVLGKLRKLHRYNSPKTADYFSNELPGNLSDAETHIKTLLASDEYISRRQYQTALEPYKPVISYLKQLNRDQLLPSFCKKHSLKVHSVRTLIEKYDSIRNLTDKHNEDFLKRKLRSEKEYLDEILKGIDPHITLDDEQRAVVLTDEDYCLVIAGAGAGKTTTVAAKIKYLVEGKEYILTEKIAPKGYELAESITFTAKDGMKITMKDKLIPEIPQTGDQTNLGLWLGLSGISILAGIHYLILLDH